MREAVTVVLDVDGKLVGVGVRDIHIPVGSNDRVNRITINKTKDELKSAEAFQLDTTSKGSGGSLAPATNPPANNR